MSARGMVDVNLFTNCCPNAHVLLRHQGVNDSTAECQSTRILPQFSFAQISNQQEILLFDTRSEQ